MNEQRKYAPEHQVFSTNYAMAVFGGKNTKGDAWVLNLLFASRFPGEKRVDWQGDTAVQFQIGALELVPLLAVLLGYAPQLKLTHFNRGDKEFEIFVDPARQSDAMSHDGKGPLTMRSLRYGQMDTARAVQLSRADQFEIVTMAFRSVMRNHGGLDQVVLHRMVREVTTSHSLPRMSGGDEELPERDPR